eukprot:CAMPEP_0175989086 /NCGR_PEP_ID=MMETSP0108-20121206/51583_1 /TAXON_ID=195067 ORGANISM="Goniomonas pacifica, Strain CCMP1869" /NCGR_SAMPLE_ID=MMETSP0108 /ASSEMBLY_ACC=CAM_ASM_000204 /LENGTH=152 /DNA_ID=CAMNT_0017320463 /DNA_START=25 /DNA_END=480 /DNA_ORIENTATION=-
MERDSWMSTDSPCGCKSRSFSPAPPSTLGCLRAIKRLDLFTRSHFTKADEPVTCKRTVMGGAVTSSLLICNIVILCYILAVAVTDVFSLHLVTQRGLLGFNPTAETTSLFVFHFAGPPAELCPEFCSNLEFHGNQWPFSSACMWNVRHVAVH